MSRALDRIDMSDLGKNISEEVRYTAEHSQLVVTSNTTISHKQYHFDSVVFARVQTGIKHLIMQNGQQVTLTPNSAIMTSIPVQVEVEVPLDLLGKHTHCFYLEIDKTKVWDMIEKIDFQRDTQLVTRTDNYPAEMALYGGTTSKLVIQVLDQLQQLLVSDVKFKDQWVNLKVEELILCCLQTQIFENLLHAYQESRLLDGPLAAVVAHLKQNFHQKIQIEDLTKIACMSQASLFRHFKNCLGQTPLEFIRHERLANAKRLLRSSDASISEIGYQVGYTSPSYFNTQFKKEYACSPSTYREAHRGR